MNLPADWPRCRPWIEAALEHSGGTHWIEDVEAMLRRGELYFVSNEGAALVLQHVVFPRLSVLNIFLGGGQLDAVRELVGGLVTEAARTLRCDAISLEGRPGWKRALAPLGFTSLGVTLGKRLTDGVSQGQGRV